MGKGHVSLTYQRPSFSWLTIVASGGFLIVLVVVPLVNMLLRVSPVNSDVLGRSGTWRVIGSALGQASLSTALTLLVGLPLAYFLARYRFFGRSFIRVLVTVPFVMPTVVVALAFTLILPAALNYGLLAVLLAHVFVNVAIVVRVVGGALSQADGRFSQVAQTLGATPLRGAIGFTFRYAAPAVAAATAVVFIFCFTSLGLVLLLGGGRVPTLELEILRQTTLLVNLDAAVMLSLTQTFFVAVALGVAYLVQRRTTFTQVKAQGADQAGHLPRRYRGFIYLTLTGVTALFVTPLVALVVSSFLGSNGFTLSWWRAFWSFGAGTTRYVNPFEALQASLTFAVGAGLLAGGIAVASAVLVVWYPRLSWLTLLLIAPLGISAVTIGLALLLTYGSGGLNVASSEILIVLSHSLIAVPLVLSATLPAIRSLDPKMMQVASTLGARPWRSLVTAYGPALSRAALLAGGLAAGVSFGEFGAASVLTRVDGITLPLAIVRLLSRPGEASLGVASVAAVILMAVVALVVWGFDRLATK